MKPLIEVQGLVVRRGEREVLRIESLSIPRGGILAVVGPNGAGKSTLLLSVARLLKWAEGQIFFGGIPMSQIDDLAYRRRIAVVFQDPLLVDLTVEENVALGLRFRGTRTDDIRPRVRKWLRRLGIESLAERRAGELSGGEARRVSLARAVVLDPELLLLDEPFSSLDPPTRASLIQDLSGIMARDHQTAIFATHDLDEAARLSDRVAVLVGGVLRQVGSARQIKASPADAEVAAFLRTMPR